MMRPGHYADSVNQMGSAQMQHMPSQRLQNSGMNHFQGQADSFQADEKHQYMPSNAEGQLQWDRDGSKESNLMPSKIYKEVAADEEEKTSKLKVGRSSNRKPSRDSKKVKPLKVKTLGKKRFIGKCLYCGIDGHKQAECRRKAKDAKNQLAQSQQQAMSFQWSDARLVIKGKTFTIHAQDPSAVGSVIEVAADEEEKTSKLKVGSSSHRKPSRDSMQAKPLGVKTPGKKRFLGKCSYCGIEGHMQTECRRRARDANNQPAQSQQQAMSFRPPVPMLPAPSYQPQPLQARPPASQWSDARLVNKGKTFAIHAQDPSVVGSVIEGERSDAPQSQYRGQMSNSRSSLEKQGGKDARSQDHNKDEMELGYEDDTLPETFEGLEKKFLQDIMKLTKEQQDAEDTENARHRERLNEINSQYEEKLLGIRARQTTQRDEFLRRESQARNQQYLRENTKSYQNRTGPSEAHVSYRSAAMTSGGMGDPHQAYTGDRFDNYGEQPEFVRGAQGPRFEPRGQYPGGRAYNTGGRQF